MSNSKKHKILKELKTHWDDGEEQTKGGKSITLLGRSLTILQLSKLTNLSSDKVQDLCDSLAQIKIIEKIKEDSEGKSHSYIIKDSGKPYVTDKIFYYKVWFRNPDFWKFFLPLIIGIMGLLNSIFGWLTAA